MDKVKNLIAAGSSIPGAIKEALSQNGLSVARFASKYGLNRVETSNVINGSVRASDRYVSALIAELGGDAFEWRVLLHRAGAPVPPEPVAAVGGG